MGSSAYESDTAFFNLIHRLTLASKRKKEESPVQPFDLERREKARAAYSCQQLIAPGYCGTVPPLSAFTKVRCYDLSCNGFSFLFHQYPNFDQFVVLFRVPSPVYITSRLTFVRQVWIEPNGKVLAEPPQDAAAGDAADGPPGKSQFLVGSEFVHRLTSEPASRR
jgi:hypothetical protein